MFWHIVFRLYWVIMSESNRRWHQLFLGWLAWQRTGKLQQNNPMFSRWVKIELEVQRDGSNLMVNWPLRVLHGAFSYALWGKKSFELVLTAYTGREIAPDTGANVTKFFTLATKSWKLVANLATRMFHHSLIKRYSELKRFAKINPRQTSSLSLFPKRSTCISIDN